MNIQPSDYIFVASLVSFAWWIGYNQGHKAALLDAAKLLKARQLDSVLQSKL